MTQESAPADSSPHSGVAGLVPITELLSYRLQRVSSSLSRSAAARYRREFDVSLGEWRTIALLGTDIPFTLNRLARRAALDKAQMSRVVANLVKRGLVRRTSGPGRTTQLTLTEAGQSLYLGLITAANERNDLLLDLLDEQERATLDAVLEKLAGLALSLERTEP